MDNRVDRAVRTWFLTLPGLVKSDVSRHDCYAHAWAMSGIECSLGDFKDALNRVGYEAKQLRTFRHTIWHLSLPSTGQPRYV